MKKFFEKPYNLMFAASALMFLQFLSAIIYIYVVRSTGFFALDEFSGYIYIAYCLAACVIPAIFIMKKNDQKNKKSVGVNYIDRVKLWLSAFFLYIFCEILWYVKYIYTAYVNLLGLTSEEIADFVYVSWENQPLYRLYLCIGILFLIYFTMVILEKKKSYILPVVINLVISGLFIIFMPGGEYLLIYEGTGIGEVILVAFIREAGSLLLMFNMFIFAMREFYDEK